MKILMQIIALSLFINSNVSATMTPDPENSKHQGLVFLNMIQSAKAKPLLQISASNGDAESQFYLAEILRRDSSYITTEAQGWYQAAAEKGDIYAMMRLANKKDDLCHIMENCPPDIKTPKQWSEAAQSFAKARASRGDAEAMFQLFLMGGKFDLLIRAAEAGFGRAQYRLASIYEEGFSTFWIPGSRKKEIEKWYLASAEGGYPPGMVSYGELLDSRGDSEGYGYWIAKAAEAGHFSAMSGLAAWTAHMPDEVGYPLDLVKAYGLTLLMDQADPGGGPNSPGYGGQVLPEVAAKMTPEQIEAGKAYAVEWAKTHPPLSRFPPKYGY